MKIAILGAPGSGKTSLVVQLQQQLQARHLDCSVVPDDAQAWCQRHQAAVAAANDTLAQSITLLCGLDLPSSQAKSAQQQAHDSELRGLLQSHGMDYHVVYGLGPQRSANALKIIQHRLKLHPAEATPKNDWVWVCDKCSDSACEHKLFTEKLGISSRSQPFY